MRDEEGISIFVLTGRSDSHSQELLDFIKRSGIKASKESLNEKVTSVLTQILKMKF